MPVQHERDQDKRSRPEEPRRQREGPVTLRPKKPLSARDNADGSEAASGKSIFQRLGVHEEKKADIFS